MFIKMETVQSIKKKNLNSCLQENPGELEKYAMCAVLSYPLRNFVSHNSFYSFPVFQK